MRFAVNYSVPLINLLNEGLVKIDLIKCPDWEGMLTEARPFGDITIHYDLKIGLGKTFNIDLNRIETLQKKTHTPHINTHLVTPRNFDPDNSHEMQKINHLWREEIQIMIDRFGASNIVLEHFPYTLTTPHIRPAADSKIFSNVILDAGCMLLLDIAHARITADTLGMDVRQYISAFPLDRLVELHITGIKKFNGVLTDHFELSQEDYELLSWALNEINRGNWRRPEIIALEYGGVGTTFTWRTDPLLLREQVPKLYQMIHTQK